MVVGSMGFLFASYMPQYVRICAREAETSERPAGADKQNPTKISSL